MESSSRRVIVVGSANVDFVMRVPHLPARGETVTEGTFLQTYGGKGANQAVAALRAGANTTFVACLGQDEYGERQREMWMREGMDVSQVRLVSGVPSGSALVMVDGAGENYLTVAPGANYELLPAHLDSVADSLNESVLLMQNEIPAETIRRALALADRQGAPVVFNYAPVRDRAVPLKDLRGGLVVNEVEAAALAEDTGEVSPKDLACRLAELGPQWVVLTLGSKGSVLYDGSEAVEVPAKAVRAVDSTGAGDTFCGALCSAIAEDKGLLEAVHFATVAASISVQKMGAQPSIPNRAVIDQSLAGS